MTPEPDVIKMRADVETILALAHDLSNRLKGHPAMYEANKILHAAWAIQAAIGKGEL